MIQKFIYSCKILNTIPIPPGMEFKSTHSSLVCAPPPFTVPIVLAGIPRDNGIFASVELGA